MTDDFTLKSIQVDAASMAYIDEGVGAPLVFLHGFPLSHAMWHGQIDVFSATHRVIAPDLRGHGQTSVTEGSVTMAEMADDVAHLLDAINVLEPVTLCGLSMGGYVAWEFWRRHRSRLGRLILCDTRAIADTEQVARARQMMAAQVEVAGSNGPQIAADAMLSKLMAPQAYDEQCDLVDLVQQMILNTAPHGIAATQRGMAERIDMTPLLPEVDLPTLVLCGVKDEISPPDEMQQFAEAMPGAQFVAIGAAGHLAPLEQPFATNNAIRDFLASAG